MSSYLITNYKGVYNLDTEIDRRTGDFCRDKNENLENFTDIWIVCQGKCKIFYYGKGILEYYCPSLGRGHNILKDLYEFAIGSTKKFETETLFDYDSMYKELETANVICGKVEETSEEVLFKFKASNLDNWKSILKPRTSCLRSPFSTLNLRRNVIKEHGKYVIDKADLERYKEITSLIPKSDMRMYIDLNNAFISQIATKKHSADDIKREIKIGGFKCVEYFHHLGNDTWKKYLEFLDKQIKEKYNN